MTDKLMNIPFPNSDTQNYPFCGLNVCTLFVTTNQNSLKSSVKNRLYCKLAATHLAAAKLNLAAGIKTSATAVAEAYNTMLCVLYNRIQVTRQANYFLSPQSIINFNPLHKL